MRRTLLLLALCAPLAGAAQTSPPTRTTDGVLTDTNGMTLYVSDADGPLRSSCAGDCARDWQPLPAESNAKPWADYAPFARADGVKQWAYKGRPLYRFARDKAPGDRSGDGAGSTWRVAMP